MLNRSPKDNSIIELRASPTPLQNLLQNVVGNGGMNKQKNKLLHLWSNHFFVCSLLHFPLHFAVNYGVGLEMLLVKQLPDTFVDPYK